MQKWEYSLQVKNLSEKSFFSFQPAAKKHPKVKMDFSFWIETLHIYLCQQQL